MGWTFYTVDGVEKTASDAGVAGPQGPQSGANLGEGTEGAEPWTPAKGATGDRGPEGARGPLPSEPDEPEQPLFPTMPRGEIGRALHRIVVITATGTYTPTPRILSAIEVHAIAGGGGADGASPGALVASAAGGGGGGSYAFKVITPVATSYAVTIGAGGIGGVPPADPTDGGQTIFGSPAIITTNGGGFTQLVSDSPRISVGGTGGAVSTGGDFNLSGAPGKPGITLSTGATQIIGGNGGNGLWGQGAGRGNQAAGSDALANSGAGGGGGSATAGGANVNGGAGGSGVIVVFEFLE